MSDGAGAFARAPEAQKTAIENDIIYGRLGNEPGNLPGLALGSKVKSSVSQLNDWCYVDPQGELQGGVTIKVVHDAMKKNRKS